MSEPYNGETGGKCVEITGVHGHYYDGVCYNTDQEKADAERIVACVNACAGIPTEELPKVGQMVRMKRKGEEINNHIFGRFPTRPPTERMLEEYLDIVWGVNVKVKYR